jgi:disulfide bond formation protein DsbB
MIKTGIQSLATLVLLSDIFIVTVVLLFIAEKMRIVKWFSKLRKSFAPYALMLAFTVALTSTLGSLFFSEVAKYQPCLLCWYQRIFMYPQALLLYLAILRKEIIIKPYLIALSVVGGLISTYHYFIQRFPAAEVFRCDATGVSCTRGSFYFGFISIPFMALTGFLLIIILLLITEPAFVKTTTAKKKINRE